ncbi:hypothetical protein [Leifsonia shinshuensis]
MSDMPTVFEPNEIRREAIDHALGQVRRYEAAIALHEADRSELSRRHEQDLANLAHWKRRLEKIQETTSSTRADAAEARALRWSRGRLADPAGFAEDYARYIEDAPEPRDPDLPLLTPEEYADEHVGEWETLDDAARVAPLVGGVR